jgi:hypothetical protein
MANPNPNPATRFQVGNTGSAGRPAGSRDKLSAAFIRDLAEVWEVKGRKAIEDLADSDKATFVRVVASLQPKEVEFKSPLDDVSDDQLTEAIAFFQAMLSKKAKRQPEQRVN